MSRNKGARWEREVANAWAAAIGQPVKRGLGQPRAGNEVPDVDAPGFWPECKAHVVCNPDAALTQAMIAASGTGRLPIAVCKDNLKPPYVLMALADLLHYLGLQSVQSLLSPAPTVRMPLEHWWAVLRSRHTQKESQNA